MGSQAATSLPTPEAFTKQRRVYQATVRLRFKGSMGSNVGSQAAMSLRSYEAFTKQRRVY